MIKGKRLDGYEVRIDQTYESHVEMALSEPEPRLSLLKWPSSRRNDRCCNNTSFDRFDNLSACGHQLAVPLPIHADHQLLGAGTAK